MVVCDLGDHEVIAPAAGEGKELLRFDPPSWIDSFGPGRYAQSALGDMFKIMIGVRGKLEVRQCH